MESVDLFSAEERVRYSRHFTLPEVGVGGQVKLKRASVLLIGAGGLGAPVAMYLAAAGVGRLGLVDFDRVDQSNLQRQIIHGTNDVGKPKVESAGQALADINPHVRLQLFDEPLTSENAMQRVADYDIVIDGTDNFATRYLVNDVCVLSGKPNCYGSIFQFEGQASVFALGDGPCYRCLYPKPPAPGTVPSCAEGGVLGVLPGIIGMIQATEAVKLILDQGRSLSGRLVLYDALQMRFREVKVRRDPQCPVCGDQPSITRLIDYQEFCGAPKMSSADASEQSPWDVQPSDVQKRLQSGADFILLDVREPHEYEICHLGGTLIPLGELHQRAGELDASCEIIVHCKMGGRSAKAVQQLRQLGFENVHNMRGGIHAWSDEIDSSVPKY
ncbi:putative adenylyltransferase/sulfurtransferase MoeZ [Crateriforma conspicua]|uniref:Molybdopterin-synthase adenylyltransferase n=1 Tax=Crateriforma conspicua TaxID=2527996 RepID=A0A5C5Y9N8_9PLAN|nr:putative adenylyltransferase/sulfurtransferase MoeZ [Crateriforma conspicua]